MQTQFREKSTQNDDVLFLQSNNVLLRECYNASFSKEAGWGEGIIILRKKSFSGKTGVSGAVPHYCGADFEVVIDNGGKL
jgi:hypothetical protein